MRRFETSNNLPYNLISRFLHILDLLGLLCRARAGTLEEGGERTALGDPRKFDSNSAAADDDVAATSIDIDAERRANVG